MLDGGTEYKEIRQNPLDDTIWATPAIIPGSIIIKGADSIYAIESGANKDSLLSN